MALAEQLDLDILSARNRVYPNQPQFRLGGGPVTKNRMATIPTQPRQFAKFGTVAIDDSSPAGRQQFAKQTLLCRPVLAHIAMVIEMIARQVGERRRSDDEAVEAKLRKAMARGFDRQMGDARFGETGEIAMQRHRIGRG